MIRTVTLWLASALGMLVGCATTPRALHFRVVDDATDRPLADVAADAGRSTDANGQLTLSGLPNERATRVTFTKAGYAPAALLWDDDGAVVRVVSPALIDTFGLTPLHPQYGLWPVAELVPVRLVPDPEGVARRPPNDVAR